VAFAEQPTDWLVFNSVAYGNGKTHLAAAIANYVANSGEPVLFVVVPDLLDHLRASFNPSSQSRLDKRFDEVKSASLLVLDDLGTESATAWAREKLYQLFNHRYNAAWPPSPFAKTNEQLDLRPHADCTAAPSSCWKRPAIGEGRRDSSRNRVSPEKLGFFRHQRLTLRLPDTLHQQVLFDPLRGGVLEPLSPLHTCHQSIIDNTVCHIVYCCAYRTAT
jgi:hypothetical protein